MPDLAAFVSPTQWPALEWLSHLALELYFFFFPPSHPSFCHARRLFYLHSPVASSYMYPALVLACACPQWHAKEQQSPRPLASCPGVRSANRGSRQRVCDLSISYLQNLSCCYGPSSS